MIIGSVVLPSDRLPVYFCHFFDNFIYMTLVFLSFVKHYKITRIIFAPVNAGLGTSAPGITPSVARRK